MLHPDSNLKEFSFLISFYDQTEKDNRLKTGHLNIYTCLVLLCFLNGWKKSISITRSKVMRLAKIKGKATYHRYLKELQEFGYISYQPSYHPTIGSHVTLLLFT